MSSSAASVPLLARIERAVGLTPTGTGTAVLAVLGVVAGKLADSRGVMLLAYGLILALAGAWALGRRPLTITAERDDIPSRVRVGREVEARVKVVAKRRTTSLVLAEELPPALAPVGRTDVPVLAVASLAAGDELEETYTFTPRERGVYEIGPLYVETGDPFGLTRRRRTVIERRKLIVHPLVEQVVDRISTRAWEDPPVRPPRSNPWPVGSEFYGMRDYQPGDDPRRIVWRAVAQYDKYLVRESEQGITDQVHILFDTDARNHSPGRRSDTFEAAVGAVASLTSRHLEDGFGVTVEGNEKTIADRVRSKSKTVSVLDTLAEVQPGQARFTDALTRALLSGGGSIQHAVVVTPHLEADVAARLRFMVERGASLLLVLIVWEDTEPATLHRAGMLGCPIVEVHPGAPLSRVFANAMGGAR